MAISISCFSAEIQLHAWDTEEGLVVSAPEPTAAVTTDENPTLSKEDGKLVYHLLSSNFHEDGCLDE